MPRRAQEPDIEPERLTPDGGAIAALCVGGGQGQAAIVRDGAHN